MHHPFFLLLPAALSLLLSGAPACAQWAPTGALAKVPVVRDCNETGGDVAISRFDPPAVYLCPVLEREIRRKDPGAEHFYFVHEFGHVALHTADEAEADCWAARALANARNGKRYLAAAIEHFRRRPEEDRAYYGTPRQRAERIRRCAEDESFDPHAPSP